jgi:hypothetical protein
MIKSLLRKIKNKLVVSRPNLAQLGRKNRTDKIDKQHCFAGKTYLDVYQWYLEPYRDEPITLLEIGIRGGASLRTFRDYFPKGNILGIDINPETAFTETRIKTYIGSQDSTVLMEQVFSENPEIFVMLDDGSHVNKLTIASFNIYFERLKPGGYYIIEDLFCSYLEENLERDIKEGQWPGMDLNSREVEMVNHRADMDSFFNALIRELDHRRGEVEFIHFWAQLCIIKKKG